MRFVNFLFRLLTYLCIIFIGVTVVFLSRMLPSDPVEAWMEGSWPAAVYGRRYRNSHEGVFN